MPELAGWSRPWPAKPPRLLEKSLGYWLVPSSGDAAWEALTSGQMKHRVQQGG